MRESHEAPRSLNELAPAIICAELVHHVDSLERGDTVAQWGQPPKIASPRRSDPMFGGVRGHSEAADATADAMLGFSSSTSPGSVDLDVDNLSSKRLKEALWHGRSLPNPRFDRALT
jgi:hypothetical protein